MFLIPVALNNSHSDRSPIIKNTVDVTIVYLENITVKISRIPIAVPVMNLDFNIFLLYKFTKAELLSA